MEAVGWAKQIRLAAARLFSRHGKYLVPRKWRAWPALPIRDHDSVLSLPLSRRCAQACGHGPGSYNEAPAWSAYPARVLRPLWKRTMNNMRADDNQTCSLPTGEQA